MQVRDADGFNASVFDGIYKLTDMIQFGRAVWADVDDPDDRYLYHSVNDWILNGKDDEQMAYSDSEFSDHTSPLINTMMIIFL